jgi:flagellar hook-associated protein 2
MANEISFSGLGSGIDFTKIRDAIIASRSRPLTQLQAKSNNYSSRVDALKKLNASLAALTISADALQNKEIGSTRAAVSSDASILTSSATGAASLGQFDVTVTRLATNLTQASRSYPSSSTAVLAGGATTATFELRKGGAVSGTAITIDSANNTLAGLRDAINNANAGVTATIVDLNGDGAQQQLVLSSKDTGAANRVELVETTSTGTLTDLNLRNLNPIDGDFSKLDASLSVNGLSITRSSNTVADAVTGVTLNLKKAGTASVQINASTEIKSKLQAFIDAYNAVHDFAAGQYKKDDKGRPTGVLVGDPTLVSVQKQLREAVSAFSTTNGGALTSLSEIGVGRDENGKLTLDSAVFDDKIKNSYDDVKALLVGKASTETGLAQSIHTAVNSLSDEVTGSVQTAIKGYQDSIKSIGDSISRKLENINRLRDSLTRQFAAADAAIGQLNGQGTSLTNILKSLQPNNNK